MRPSRRQTEPFARRWTPGRPSATAFLIALSVGAFAAQLVLQYLTLEHPQIDLLDKWLQLDRQAVEAGRYWTFLTFPLLHRPLQLLPGMLLLYFAGREVEQIIGPKHFLLLYIGGTYLGGLTHLALTYESLMGTTAGVAAVVVAFATILPELEVTVNLFYVLPVRLRAKYLAAAILGVSLLLAVKETLPPIAQIGPAGVAMACMFSWIYVKQLGFGNPLRIQRYIFQRRQRIARMERMTAEQFISAEVDPILDKISREGMHSLSRTERKILARGRDKIAEKTTRR